MADNKQVARAAARQAMAKQNKPAPAVRQAKPAPGSKNIRKMKEQKGAVKDNKSKSLLKNVAKITTLPKDVRSSIPLRGFMSNGVIETDPGVFTKSYKLEDVNFAIATDERKSTIFKKFMDLLNSFNEGTRWQFNIFNHEIDKKETIQNLRVPPKTDGLNKYRKELNGILFNALKNGKNLITQDKYLTVSIEDENADQAVTRLANLDNEISTQIRAITSRNTKPLTTQERMKLLYDIYNQDTDYRMATGILNKKEVFDLRYIERCGLSVKDVIGPTSFDFSKTDTCKIGDMYAQGLFLEYIPPKLSTDFIADIADIQCNMLISVTSEIVDHVKAVKFVKNKLADLDGKVGDINSRNLKDGTFGSLPPDLARARETTSDLLNDMTGRNQNMFFMTVVIFVFARTEELLKKNVSLVKSTAQTHIARISPMSFQQEFCLNTALPLCRNDLFVDKSYTTESAAVLIPYNSQELNQKDALFYGINQVSKRMLLFNRLNGDNYNGLVFGYPGSGKSFATKMEMMSVLLKNDNAQVFVIDPQGEYYPLVKPLHGQEIKLSPGSGNFINPLDLDISEQKDDEVDPITMKSDFIVSMFETILNNMELSPIHVSTLDKCVRRILSDYVAYLRENEMTCDTKSCPTLEFLRQELLRVYREEDRFEAKQLADVIEQYTAGSFNTFSHRTNVETDAKFVVYNTKSLGTGMEKLGLHICTNDIWNRMIRNSKRGVYTYFYIDEFHILLESDAITRFLKRVWKMARKWKGVPTGIMQNTDDLLKNSDTKAIIGTTSFVMMFNEERMDRENLQELYKLSQDQMSYITDSDPGTGLIYNGKVTLPFNNLIPKNTELYRIFSTKSDVEGVQFA